MTCAITFFQQHVKVLSQGLVATVTRVPIGLDSQDPLRERYDDRSISVSNKMGAIWIEVKDPRSDSLAAIAVFAADDQVVRCDTVDVQINYRRLGIATEIYKLASCEFAAPVVPSDLRTSDAEKFWGDRDQITVS